MYLMSGRQSNVNQYKIRMISVNACEQVSCISG